MPSDAPSLWNIKVLLIPPTLALLLLLSWKIPLTASLWERCDQAIFSTLNPWIQTSKFWQHFWAFNTSRTMDWIHDVSVILFFFVPAWQPPEKKPRRKTAELLFSLAALALIIALVNGTLFPEFLHCKRKSPTALDPTSFRLSSVIHWIKVKDLSYESFPGDHGTFILSFAFIAFHLIGRKAGYYAILYSVFFCLPRLITGAHWFTDIFLGSLSIATILTSLLFGTPCARVCIQRIDRFLSRFCRPSSPPQEPDPTTLD